MANPQDDSDQEDLFASPSTAKAPKTQLVERPKTPSNNHSRYEDHEDAREAGLQRELEGVRNINELIEGVIGTLERAKGNMQTVSNTVNTASTLLNTWTRILSQTEHNQRLLLNPSWKGASQDLADIESEAAARAAAAERRAAEEERRRAEYWPGARKSKHPRGQGNDKGYCARKRDRDHQADLGIGNGAVGRYDILQPLEH
ncbi:DASH complex subunit Duo1-domain-containing protein [Nemania serpens]|nr:DASH complex subunit Duo1-domain-containing protein [Nemania serpens]